MRNFRFSPLLSHTTGTAIQYDFTTFISYYFNKKNDHFFNETFSSSPDLYTKEAI